MANWRNFNAKATGFEFTEASTGSIQMVIDLVVTDPQKSGRTTGDALKWFATVNENTVDWLSESLRALGMENDNILEPVGLGRLQARVSECEEEYNGNYNWRVKRIQALKIKRELSQDSHDMLSALLKSALSNKEVIPTNETNAAPEKVVASEVVTEEDF